MQKKHRQRIFAVRTVLDNSTCLFFVLRFLSFKNLCMTTSRRFGAGRPIAPYLSLIVSTFYIRIVLFVHLIFLDSTVFSLFEFMLFQLVVKSFSAVLYAFFCSCHNTNSNINSLNVIIDGVIKFVTIGVSQNFFCFDVFIGLFVALFLKVSRCAAYVFLI